MKSLQLILLTVSVVFAIGLLPPANAIAENTTCVFKADDNVHVVVWDEDSDEDRQGKIYAGDLETGDRHEIHSKTGYIVFSYKRAADDRSYGDNHRRCKNGNIIRVP